MEKVKEVFTEMLGLAADVDWDSVAYQSTEGWDSLAHMAIVGELEDRFGIMLDPDDVIDMSSFAKALEILARHGVGTE